MSSTVSEESEIPLHSTDPASVEAGRARRVMSDCIVRNRSKNERKRIDNATGTVGEKLWLWALASLKVRSGSCQSYTETSKGEARFTLIIFSALHEKLDNIGN